MRKTTIVLLVLCVVSLALAAPVAADDEDGEATQVGPCVTVYVDSPGVVVDPWCLLPEDFPPS